MISSSLKLSNGIDGAGTILVEYPEFQGELLYSKITDSRVPSQIQGGRRNDGDPGDSRPTGDYYLL
ncbi:MAG TPA: hypothetical protein IAA00_06000 [Candidatus Blautia ornithocaccae]|nr:hypothetical protein [Candidatus Blautia ornithocaccae]